MLKEDNRVKLYAEFIINSQFNYENYAWILCGENEIISNCMTNACRFNLDLKYDFAFERGASFCVFDMLSSEIICYGEYGAPLLDFNGITKYAKKNCKNYQENYETAPSASGEQNCNFRYDDESIATEDYFK